VSEIRLVADADADADAVSVTGLAVSKRASTWS
jgi:hypothetical protein